MGLESAEFIAGLDESWPTGLDPLNKGDDHLRLIKKVLKDQFPGVGLEGYAVPILALEVDLNNCVNSLGNFQAQITANTDNITLLADQADTDALGLTPIGGIIMFNAVFANIPLNWQLCNGTNGTPNMTNQFVYGTNTESELLDAGGSADSVNVSHGHDIVDPEHLHGVPSGVNSSGSGVFREASGNESTNSESAPTGITIVDSGESGAGKNIPPFIKLAFIQRMS